MIIYRQGKPGIEIVGPAALHNPAGGVVSLHEVPDFLRLLAAQCQSA